MSAPEGHTDRVPQAVAGLAHRLKRSPSSHEIRAWAAESGLDGTDDWPVVKVELRRQLGIDYDRVAGLQVAIDALRLAEAACRDDSVVDLPSRLTPIGYPSGN